MLIANYPSGDADDSVYSVLCTQHEALLSHLYKASLKYDSEGTLLVKHLSSLLQVKFVHLAHSDFPPTSSQT